MVYSTRRINYRFYELNQGQSCIIAFNNIDKCYKRIEANRLWNIIRNYSIKYGKKFTTRKHMAGIEVTRIL